MIVSTLNMLEQSLQHIGITWYKIDTSKIDSFLFILIIIIPKYRYIFKRKKIKQVCRNFLPVGLAFQLKVE